LRAIFFLAFIDELILVSIQCNVRNATDAADATTISIFAFWRLHQLHLLLQTV